MRPGRWARAVLEVESSYTAALGRTTTPRRTHLLEYLPNFFVERPDGWTAPRVRPTGFWSTLRIPGTPVPGDTKGG